MERAAAPSPGRLVDLAVPSPELPETIDPTAETLATAQAWPTALALDATHVYWANWGGYLEGGVRRVPKQGGPPQVLARSSNRPDSLALDGSYAYFAERVLGALSRVPLSGGEPLQVVDGVRDLAWVLGDHVIYFQSRDAGIRAIADQGGGTHIAVPTGPASATLPLRLHGKHVYWNEHFFPDQWSGEKSSQRIWRGPIEGGEPELLVSEPENVLTSMAVDDDAVYYALAGTLPECACEGSYLKAAAHGSALPRTLAAVRDAQISAIVSDATNIYWATGSSIQRTSKDGVSSVTLASGLREVGALAIDAEHLYFVTYEQRGSVRRIAK